jgi:hypothetical protein
MNLLKGLVTSLMDSNKTSRFKASLYGMVDTTVIVTYTSPYYDVHSGGMFAMPVIGSEVLIIYDAELGEYYYLSTIVAPHTFSGKDSSIRKEPLINEKKVYTKAGSPRAITVTNSKGAGLKISNYFSDNTEPIHDKVVLKSTQGHKLLLSDNPNMDCVILRNKDGDGITITANKNAAHSDNSIDVKAKTSIRQTAYTGEVSIRLIDGRDLWIENNSNGSNASESSYGNVNIGSMWKDINLYADGVANPQTEIGGRVFISTAEGIVQINSGGGITIYAKTDVNIASVNGDINLQAANNINLDAGNGINLRSGAELNLTTQGAATLGGNAGATVGKTGTPLNLNSNVTITAPQIDTIILEQDSIS